jgi:predicted transcriptional regulator
MKQFDTETGAALTQLEYEGLSVTPGGEFTELIGDLISLGSRVGSGASWAAIGSGVSLSQKVRKLAGASYASNLIYVTKAVQNDLTDLYKKHKELRERIKSLATDPLFSQAISALALRTMHTSVRERLRRLARIIASGVENNDLEPEGIDDMLRAATELTDRDIVVLRKISEQQHKITIYSLNTVDGTINFPREVWQVLEEERFITPESQMEVRSSLARLQAVGFGAEIQTMESSWRPRFLVSPAGEKFLNYLQGLDKSD